MFRRPRLRAANTKKGEPQLCRCSSPLGGGYLLSHFRSTIGVVRLNFSVRNGKRWDPHAMTTLVSLYSPTAMPAGVMLLKSSRGTLPYHRGAAVNRQLHSAPYREPSACTATPVLRLYCFGCLGERISHRKSSRVISTTRLRTLPPVHLSPINVVVFNDPQGNLILWLASCLDAFSTYPYPTQLPGRAPGGTTGVPEVGPTRSSRTSVRATQISYAHNR